MTDIALVNLRRMSRWCYPLEMLVNVALICWRFRQEGDRQNSIFDVHGAGNIAPVIAARLLNVPLVWHFHEADVGRVIAWLAQFGLALVRNYPHKCIGVSRRTVAAHGITDASIIYAPVDLDFWGMRECEREIRSALPGTALKIVSVGNLNPLKGMDVLLEAIARLDMPVELTIVGAELSSFRRYAEDLRALARRAERQNGSVVRFVGWCSPEEVRRLLVDAGVFVLASHSEAGPMVLYEAMAAECVCVISDVGDAREIVGDESAGFVIDQVTPGRVVQAIKRIEALSMEERLSVGAAARQRLMNRFSVELTGQQHLDIYTGLFAVRA